MCSCGFHGHPAAFINWYTFYSFISKDRQSCIKSNMKLCSFMGLSSPTSDTNNPKYHDVLKRGKEAFIHTIPDCWPDIQSARRMTSFLTIRCADMICFWILRRLTIENTTKGPMAQWSSNRNGRRPALKISGWCFWWHDCRNKLWIRDGCRHLRGCRIEAMLQVPGTKQGSHTSGFSA